MCFMKSFFSNLIPTVTVSQPNQGSSSPTQLEDYKPSVVTIYAEFTSCNMQSAPKPKSCLEAFLRFLASLIIEF